MNLSCNHEEADTRLFVHVHVHHAIKHSAIKTVVVLSNDVDIVVIAVAVFADLQQDGLQKLWVAFGQSNKRRWMPIHTLFEKLGKEKSIAHLFSHAFSGCDVSGFKGKGKKMLFQTWSSFPDATQTFMKLSSQPQMVNSHDLDVLEKFTVVRSTTDPVLNQMWIPLDALYSLRRIDLTIKYRQPRLPCFNMTLCFVLHTRLDTFGVRRLFHMQDYHIQTNGAGKKEKMGHCMYTGLTITQSLMHTSCS